MKKEMLIKGLLTVIAILLFLIFLEIDMLSETLELMRIQFLECANNN